MTKRIIGSGGGGKGGGGGEVRAPVEGPDTLRSKQFAKIIDVVSEGEIEGLVDGLKSIYLDDVPILSANGTYNFKNVVVHERAGTQDQTYIPGFSAVENEIPVNIEVKSTNTVGVTRTVNNPEADAVRITVGIPQLLEQNKTTGDITGTSVAFQIKVNNELVPIYQRYDKVANPTTVAGTNFKITVGWSADVQYDNTQTAYDPNTGQYVYGAPFYRHSADFQLWYKSTAAGSTWTTYGSPFTLTSFTTPVTNVDPETGITTTSETVTAGTKNIAVQLPSDKYQFKVVKSQPNTSHPGTSTIEVQMLGNVYTAQISGKCSSRYQTSYVIKLNGSNPWEIELKKITPDATTSNLHNSIWWDSFTEIVYAKLSYPNSALFGVEIDSSQFQNIPTRGYLINGIKVKVPINYDAENKVYDGTWNGEWKISWTDNPAWVFYDLITNDRYGLGNFIAEDQIDKWSLYQISKYCDEKVPDGFGGWESRFTCNLYLQTREEAYSVINNLASIFRGIIWWGLGTILAVQDAPADSIAIFNTSNVVNGVFNYSGSSKKQRHTVALIGWNDPEDLYRQRIEYVENTEAIDKYGIIEKELIAFGCTSRGQAHRLGKWLLLTEYLETETISFTTGLEGFPLFPGAIIETSDPIRSGKRLGGRLEAVPNNYTFTLDNPIDLDTGVTYTLYISLPDGSLEAKPISNSPGIGITDITINISDPNILETYTTPFRKLPEVGCIYILASNAINTELWRIVGLSEADNNTISVSAVEHNPGKYALVEHNLALPPRETTSLKVIPDPVSSLTVLEGGYSMAPPAIGIRAILSWISNESNFLVKWRDIDGSWSSLETQANTADIIGLQPISYEFEVIAVNSLGVKSLPVSTTHNFAGKDIPPADIDFFSAQVKDGLVIFKWSPVGNEDLAGYEIRYNTVDNTRWEDGATVTSTTRGTSVTTGIVPPGTWLFMIKARDFAGNESTNYTSSIAAITNTNTIIFTRNEEEFWETGLLDNMVIHQPTRSIAVTSLSDAYGAGWDTFESNTININPIGHYTSPIFNIGQLDEVRILASLIAKLLKNGTGIADPNFQIRVLKDAVPGFYPPAWTEWEPASCLLDWQYWDVGFQSARYIQFRIVADTTVGTYYINKFTPTVDKSERLEFQTEVAVGTAGATFSFAKPFFFVPNIRITPISATAANVAIVSQSTTAFTVKVYNASGTAIAGTINWEARGV